MKCVLLLLALSATIREIFIDLQYWIQKEDAYGLIDCIAHFFKLLQPKFALESEIVAVLSFMLRRFSTLLKLHSGDIIKQYDTIAYEITTQGQKKPMGPYLQAKMIVGSSTADSRVHAKMTCDSCKTMK